jgi:hypothetical protein
LGDGNGLSRERVWEFREFLAKGINCTNKSFLCKWGAWNKPPVKGRFSVTRTQIRLDLVNSGDAITFV